MTIKAVFEKEIKKVCLINSGKIKNDHFSISIIPSLGIKTINRNKEYKAAFQAKFFFLFLLSTAFLVLHKVKSRREEINQVKSFSFE